MYYIKGNFILLTSERMNACENLCIIKIAILKFNRLTKVLNLIVFGCVIYLEEY
jgi:hypothetical protein